MESKIETVLQALRADAELTGLLKGQYVYWQRPSSKPPSNYITIFEVSNAEVESADDEEYADEIEIQADIWTKGSTIPIAKCVQRIMRQLGFTHQAMPDDYDDSTGINHKPIRFFIKVEV